MDERIFSVLDKAINELDYQSEINIEQMKKVYDEGLYFVAFIGQFSAGKSCLINNLIGRKILPQGSVETTPMLTYIRYGEEDKVILHLKDGREENIAVEDVKDIMQKNNSSDWNIEDMDYLEIYLTEDLFKQGMILLDTPGINTIIQRHEDLFYDSMSLASKVIYVSSNTPSKVDVERLKDLSDHGLSISFVRTHCDEIKESEESYSQVVADDLDILQLCNMDATDCFHVSNMEDSKYFSKINDVRELLIDKGTHVKEELEKDTANQLKIIADDCKAKLSEVRDTLSEQKVKDTDALKERQKKIDAKIQSLNTMVNNYRERLKSKVYDCQNEVKSDIKVYKNRAIEKAVNNIREADFSTADNTAMIQLMQKETNTLVETLFNRLNSQLDPILVEINGELKANDVTLFQTELPSVVNYTDFAREENYDIQELYNKLAEIKRSKDDVNNSLKKKMDATDYTQLEQDLRDMEDDVSRLQGEYNSMGPYVPKMIEVRPEGMQPSDVGRTVGNALDWLTMLIPVGGVGKVAVTAATKLGVVGKMAKVIGSVEKVAGIAKTGSTIKDTIFAVKNMSKTYRTARRVNQAKNMIETAVKGVSMAKEAAPSSVLDYLTIQHWGEKIGKCFDTPPKLVIDEEYEREYKLNKNKIEQELREKQRIAYNKKCEFRLFKSEADKLKAKRESLDVSQKEVEEKLESKKAQIKAEANRKALMTWKNNCAEWYQSKVDEEIDSMMNQYLEDIPTRLENYQDKRSQKLIQQLENEKLEYKKLVNMPPSEVDEKLSNVNSLLNDINKVQKQLEEIVA